MRIGKFEFKTNVQRLHMSVVYLCGRILSRNITWLLKRCHQKLSNAGKSKIQTHIYSMFKILKMKQRKNTRTTTTKYAKKKGGRGRIKIAGTRISFTYISMLVSWVMFFCFSHFPLKHILFLFTSVF